MAEQAVDADAMQQPTVSVCRVTPDCNREKTQHLELKQNWYDLPHPFCHSMLGAKGAGTDKRVPA